MSKKKPDYSIRMVTGLLEGYQELAQGRLPWDKLCDYGVQIDRSRFSFIPFVSTVKADIDRAIRYALKPTERFVILGWLIDGWSVQDCGYWIGFDILTTKDIERRAVRKMVRFLNFGVKKGV